MATPEPTAMRILRLLKDNGSKHVSGNILASALGLSRTGIWKHIQTLKAQGYRIHTHAREGYRLEEIPDKPIPGEVLPALRTTWLGRAYHYLPTVGSTNDHVMALAAKGAPHGTTAVAEEQSAGRGRLRREWVSPPERAVYLSLLLTTPLPLREASHATLIAALALVTSVRAAYGLPALIKWPNDVLIGGKKLAGILTEVQSDQDLTRFVVIGIGINVNQTGPELEGPFRYPATSLANELGHPVNRAEVVAAFLNHFEEKYERFLAEGFGGLMEKMEEHSGLLGKIVTVHTGRAEITGRAVRLTSDGALVLLSSDGTEEVIWVGDVVRVEGEFRSAPEGRE